MATSGNALLCTALGFALWSLIGLPLTLRFAPRSVAILIAPLAGWAVHSAVVLPIFFVVGFTRMTAITIAAISLAVALALWRSGRGSFVGASDSARISGWALAIAACLALAVMTGVMPKVSAEGVALAHPIFDHSKISMINEMMRLGVPPGNPYFGEIDGVSRLSYYYLWHFSAAELALMTGTSGWEADAGLTCFTALTSLMLMMGFALHLSKRVSAAIWVVAIAATGSARTAMVSVFGYDNVAALAGWPTGWGAWLFQVIWAPQHVASASCVVLAIFLLVELSRRPGILLAVVFGIVAAACFESSTWVGGVTFAPAAAAVAFILLIKLPPSERGRFAFHAAGAAVLALLLASPFIYDQASSTAIRAAGSPITIAPYQVLEDQFPDWFRRTFDYPAYWLIFLPVEFAAFYLAGAIFFFLFLRRNIIAPDRLPLVPAFLVLTVISLCVSWLLMSTVASNNDLAWRGVLPAIIVLIVVSSAGLSLFWQSMKMPLRAVYAVVLAATLVEGAKYIYENTVITPPQPSIRVFAESGQMWRAVRRHAGPTDRVANNPFFVRDMTAWPINISWALLANRRSCYAGSDLVLPFVPMTRARRDEIEDQFTRVFAGKAEPDDLRRLATQYKCRVIVIAAQDGAFASDQIARSGFYQLVEEEPARWRIYKLKN